MEQSPSTSQRQPSSRFTNTNDKHSSEAGPSRSDVSTTTNEKTTSLKSPRPWKYCSDLSGDDDYDNDRPNLRSKSTNMVSSLRTSSPQQSTSNKRKAPSGIEAPSKLIIHESCIAAGVSPSKLQSIKTKVELLEMQYPDDLPYTITLSRNTKILYLECQEYNKSLSLLKGVGNLGAHASSVLHSACVDERLQKLEADGFRSTTMRFQRLCRPEQTSRQQGPELAPSENFESTSSSEDEPIRLKRRLTVAPSPTQTPTNVLRPELDTSDEMLTRYQGFEKRLEDVVIDINIRQSTQHRSLIDEVQKKISYGLVPIDDRLTALENGVQESYQNTQDKKLTEQRIRQASQSSESALRRVKILQENFDDSVVELSNGMILVKELAEAVHLIEKRIPTLSEIDRVGRLEDEMKGVKEEVNALAEKFSQSQPDTDQITTLQEEVNTLAAKFSDLACLVENHELPASHSSTANDAALIEDLKKSKGTMMKRLATSEERLAALEEQNDRLVSKIKELERR
ncbi:hypothetical protein BTUL_0252g00140 [Botrytis tulipae]|uniref:Uncharacterized protein n=1 Tax=Botrytis tulipae TaxID=87230 RepID=A0A4Z1EA95_9HELO|nr:hypothetical protein BTUL_0252g00140 [Botrytis tulipae]